MMKRMGAKKKVEKKMNMIQKRSRKVTHLKAHPLVIVRVMRKVRARRIVMIPTLIHFLIHRKKKGKILWLTLECQR